MNPEWRTTVLNVCLRIVTLVILAAVVTTGTAGAATWHVEQDGSGDFDDIQPAVDAAAAGDTILIGPGLYDQARPVMLPGWSFEADVIVYVDKERLTFIGENRDEVVVGPMEYQDGQTEPKCFASGALTQAWRIQGVTMQNSWNGVYDNTGVIVDNCKIVSCPGPGIITGSPNGLEIVNGVFEDNGLGIFAVSPCSGVRIVDSEFTSSLISLQNTTDVAIEGCTMTSGGGGCAVRPLCRLSCGLRDYRYGQSRNYCVFSICCLYRTV